jgi:hypothetical protein
LGGYHIYVKVEIMKVEDHLKERHFRGRAWIDEEEGVAIFPLFNLSGMLMGYQQYRPSADKRRKNNPRDSRYFTYISKGVGVWGLESLSTKSRRLFVTEGIFDACRLQNEGEAAIAILANSLKPFYNWLYSLPQKIIVVGDEANTFPNALPPPQGRKDLGECSNEEIKTWLRGI